MPKVSVIIPSYNNASLISDAIDSVLNQTYCDFEIIVVDGSTDNTKEVLFKYNGRIKYFYQLPRGVSAARNLAIKNAEGEYFAFLDADDLWDPPHLQTGIEVLMKNPEISLVFAKLRVLDNEKKVGIKPVNPALTPKDFWCRSFMVTSAVIAKRECFDKVGLFDEDLKIAEDLDMWIRILSSGFKAYHIPKILASYRLDNHESLTKDPIRMHENLIKLHKKYLSKRINVPASIIKKQLSKDYYLLGKEYLKLSNYYIATKNIAKALINNPLLGLTFIKREDSLLSKYFKLIKPYLAFYYSISLYIIKRKGFFLNKDIKKVNILYYEPSSGFGGSSSFLANLVNSLDREKFNPIVVIKNYGPQIEKIKKAEIIKVKNYEEPERLSFFRFVFFSFKNIIPEIINLLFLIKRRGVKICHINTDILSGVPAIIASKLAGIPCVCFIQLTKKFVRRERVIAKLVDQFIIQNRYCYELYKQYIPARKINIVYLGIDLTDYRDFKRGEFKKEFNLDSFPIVGLVGRIVSGKGQKEFVLSAKEVIKQNPEVKFIIVGDAKGSNDRYYKQVKELVIKDGLSKSVIFTGWRTDIKDVVSDFNIVVQGTTTYPEGFGLTIIEAMALRKPVIATKIPGPSDIVIDGETGFLVPPGDIKTMAEKINFLLGHQEIVKEMGEKGRKRVEELFDINKVVKKIEELYSQVLS